MSGVSETYCRIRSISDEIDIHAKPLEKITQWSIFAVQGN